MINVFARHYIFVVLNLFTLFGVSKFVAYNEQVFAMAGHSKLVTLEPKLKMITNDEDNN